MRHIHFIGIGGIGVSALAQWYQSEGWMVTGSDAIRSLITDDLRRKGISVRIGTDPKSIGAKGVERVVYSAAVPPGHPERVRAKKLKILQYSYAEALGELTKSYKTIAIAGAHGKSTTTAMVALMLARAGFDPTVIVGTRLKEFGNSNFKKGKSEWLVLEADEFHASFLNYRPYAVICTNVDREHLDFYKTFTRVKKAFLKFFANVERGGLLVFNDDDPFLKNVKVAGKKVVRYSLRSRRAPRLKKLLKVPGAHNLANALAADTLGKRLKILEKVRDKALAKFRGTWRRFEFKNMYRGARVYDDYGHHPAEIRATLAGAREMFPTSRIWCVFQPHHQERLRILFQDFTRSFNDADQVVIVETYKVKGREKGKSYTRRDASTLSKFVKGAYYAQDQKTAQKILVAHVKKNDIIIVMGAGDITELGDRLIKP